MLIERIRLFIVLARPAVVAALALFAATGLAQAGSDLGIGSVDDALLLVAVFGSVAGFLLFSVAVNDLADEAIDRVNLPFDPSRPLVAGTARRQELKLVALSSAAFTLVASALMGWSATMIVACGLALSMAYSLPPIRLVGRGAIASVLLPACYVAVPYLLGIIAGHDAGDAPSVTGLVTTVQGYDLLLLGGLYLGFAGRLLLKDFRDIRGDAMFGKRTFVVRHGRVVTCRVSAVCWSVGIAVLAVATREPSWIVLSAWGAGMIASLVLLRRLSYETHPRIEERLISALAIIGRGTVLLLLVHLAMVNVGWTGPTAQLTVAALVVVLAGQTWSMVRHGPKGRHLAPFTEPRALSTAPGADR